MPVFAILSILFPGTLVGQVLGGIGHVVTVAVQPFSILQVNLGTINLNITGDNVIAGEDQMTVVDQSTTLFWGTNSGLQKITINTNNSAQLFVLKAVALNPTTGLADSEVPLSNTDQALISNIGRSAGSATIQYTGIALASQGIGTDSHLITFTIQAQ